MSYYMIVTLGQGFLYLLSIASSTSTRSEDKVKFLTVPPLYANTCCKPMQGMVHRRQPADRGILQAMFTNKSDENPKILTDVIVRNSGVCGKIFPAPYWEKRYGNLQGAWGFPNIFSRLSKWDVMIFYF